MGLNLNDKKAVVAEVSAQIAEAQTIVLAEYRGIQVGDMTQLRAKARESVAARCMAKVRQAMIERRNAKTPQYMWANGGTDEPTAEHNDVDDLIAAYTTDRH